VKYDPAKDGSARLKAVPLDASLGACVDSRTDENASAVQEPEPSHDSRRLTLRYPATCAVCGRSLPAGVEASWSRAAKEATCLACALPPEELARALSSAPGGSAGREFEQRASAREKRIRSRLGRASGVVLSLAQNPQSTTAWAVGARGEQITGERLDAVARDDVIVLHDRRIPGSRANIDHIVIAPTGVYVVDTKRYAGKVERRLVGGVIFGESRLYVGRRDRTKLVAATRGQSDVVATTIAAEDVPIMPVLCFVEADWGLFARPFSFGGVHVTWATALAKHVARAGAIDSLSVRRAAVLIAERFPPFVLQP
jgi:hypothetical protein